MLQVGVGCCWVVVPCWDFAVRPAGPMEREREREGGGGRPRRERVGARAREHREDEGGKEGGGRGSSTETTGGRRGLFPFAKGAKEIANPPTGGLRSLQRQEGGCDAAAAAVLLLWGTTKMPRGRREGTQAHQRGGVDAPLPRPPTVVLGGSSERRGGGESRALVLWWRLMEGLGGWGAEGKRRPAGAKGREERVGRGGVCKTLSQ